MANAKKIYLIEEYAKHRITVPKKEFENLKESIKIDGQHYPIAVNPDGGVLDVSEFDYRTAKGVRLEGLGIRPDEMVTTTRRDLYSRRDAALELAKRFLNHAKE